MRKLLPYEHQLIEALGITEEEYWQFYLARLNYKDAKAGTIYDVRNTGAEVAIVLSIVGMLAQVGAALLAPKPELPEQQKVGKQSRNAIFGPRYGFNSFQEVARYGDPVNLVYTNKEDDNKSAGGLRVNTSLVWSAVQSFGNKQFIQMLGVVGAGDIEAYDYGFTAFGQAPLEDFPAQKYWLYGNNASGPLKFGDFQLPPGNAEQDPSKDAQGAQDYTYRASKGGAIIADGYSQAFSPSSNNTLGLYDVVPINVLVLERDENGQLINEEGSVLGRSKDDLGTRVSAADRGVYWPDSWQGSDNRPKFPEGSFFTLRFVETDEKIDEDVERAAQDYRIALISTMTASSVYKLGAAKFKLTKAVETKQGREGEFTFECVESGILCEEDYETKSYLENEIELNKLLKTKKAELVSLDEERKNWPPLLTGAEQASLDAIEAKLAELDSQIEAATAIIRGELTDAQLLELASREGEFTPLIARIEGCEDNIRTYNEEIERLNDLITEELDKLRDERNRDAIQRWKSAKTTQQQNKRTARKQKNELMQKLSVKITRQGIFIDRKGTDIKKEREILKERRRDQEKERAQLLKKAAEINTPAEAARFNKWQIRYNEVLEIIKETEFQLADPERFNDYFDVKCLAKIDELAYTTVTKCDIVDFALKARVYKRISGRQSKYGEYKEPKHRDADNGLRMRTAMFWLRYKKESDSVYQRVPTVFAIRRGVEVDNFVGMRFVSNDERTKWSFKMEPIIDLPSEIRTHFGEQEVDIAYLDTRAYKNSDKNRTIPIGNGRAGYVAIHGRVLKTKRLLPPLNSNPGFIDEWGVFSMRSDTQIAFSFDGGPEIALAAVTEQQIETFPSALYQGLSLIGFNAYSGKGIQDLRTLSAYVTKGKKVRRFTPNQDGDYVVDINSAPASSTSYAPEIFLDSVLDKENGIGAYADINGIDLESLGEAMKFCRANGYFMDGVIADPQSWREFWTTVAPFSLLEFTKIGGKESLAPAAPYDENGLVNRRIVISALFNQGNILEGSYKEEFIDYGDNTEDLLATIVYRDSTDGDPFPGNTSFTIRLADASEASCIRQTFDLSAYVSRRDQAINYGMLLCSQRRWSKRAVEFKTFPTESPVAPGSYIYVQTDQNQWDNLTAGRIGSGGSLDIPLTESITSATYDALLYKGGQGVVKKPGITITDNTAPELAAFEGWLVVFGNQITSKRVFRVTEITMEEEGEVTIKAIEHPCEEQDGITRSRIVRFENDLYHIDD